MSGFVKNNKDGRSCLPCGNWVFGVVLGHLAHILKNRIFVLLSLNFPLQNDVENVGETFVYIYIYIEGGSFFEDLLFKKMLGSFALWE